MKKAGKDYKIVSIIGGQSTGKSTLLNNLFGTQFTTLNSKTTRQQITRGIWCSKDTKTNILVFDVEGSDSKERWEERSVYEQSIALFALAMSNILILNIWTHDVGRFTASNYGIIQVIIQQNMKLFKIESIKKILVIFRDFVPEEENFENLCKTIRQDIYKLWQEIHKPQEYENSRIEDFFEINFYSLGHYKYSRTEFDEQIQQLRYKFVDPQNEEYLFKDLDIQQNIPINGLQLYMEKIWNTIKQNKDLNLPSQKLMVSTYRCNEIKNEAISLIQQEIDKLKNELKYKDTFIIECQNILNKSMQYYDQNANEYSEEAYQIGKQELELNIMEQFRELFKIQITHLKIEFKQNLEKELKNQNIKKMPINKIMQNLCNLQKLLENEFKQKLKNNILVQGKWAENDILQDVLDYLYQTIQAHQDKQLILFNSEQKNQLRKDIQLFIEEMLEELNYTNFQSELHSFFLMKLSNIQQQYHELIQYLNQSNTNKIQYNLEDIKEDGFKSIYEFIQLKKKELLSYLLKKFKNLFYKTQKGTHRNLNNIQLTQIQTIFNKSKNQCLSILQSLKNFQFQRFWNSNLIDSSVPSVITIIDENEQRQIFNQFLLEIDNELNEAIKKYNEAHSSRIPKLFWGILIFFMYDDILQWLQNPIMHYITLILGSLYALFYILGISNLPYLIFEKYFVNISKYIENILSKFGLK